MGFHFALAVPEKHMGLSMSSSMPVHFFSVLANQVDAFPMMGSFFLKDGGGCPLMLSSGR